MRLSTELNTETATAVAPVADPSTTVIVAESIVALFGLLNLRRRARANRHFRWSGVSGPRNFDDHNL